MADNNNEHRKELFRTRKRNYRKSHRSVSLSLPLDKAKKLEEKATLLHYTLPGFIQSLLHAHLQGSGYVPPKDRQLQELLLALKRIGNNINQQTKFAHQQSAITPKDIQYLQRQLIVLQQDIYHALQFPPSLTELLEEHFKLYPETLPVIIDWLNSYSNDNKNITY